MKRLLTVALGAALCTLATAADARPNDFPANHGDSYSYAPDSGDNEYSRPPARRRAAQSRPRSTATTRAQRRDAATRPHQRTARASPRARNAAASRRRDGVAARGFTNYARGGASRACLTPAARALLSRIEGQFGQMQIISTCRPGARIAGTGRISRHASGNAVDFNAGGRKAQVVRWLIANHRSGGTMTYAGMSHIHVDIGPRFVSLSSGGGRWR
jgi:uncharacterized protein YcbK (DUF882 family)